MSVFYGVRLTEEMDARITATGRGKSAVIQDALKKYLNDLGGSGEKVAVLVSSEKPDKMIIEKEKRPRVERVKTVSVEIPRAREREAEVSAVSGGCRKHPDAGGFPKAGGWWCPQCGKIV